MTTTSDTIIRLISFSWKDWVVSIDEQTSVIGALRVDPNMPATIRDLQAAGMLERMCGMVTGGDRGRTLAMVLGSGVDGSTRPIVEKIGNLAGNLWYFRLSADLHTNYRRMGAGFTKANFNPVPYAALIPKGPDAKTKPFGGAGATGIAGPALSVPLWDQAQMVRHNQEILAQYSNPIPGDLFAYLATLTITQRREQAELLMGRPIVSIIAASYRSGLPSRAQVITLAARQYRLEPAMLAAFILAEQRDQSQNEDAVDYAASQSMLVNRATSIGLGQIVTTTAIREDLFSRLIDNPFRQSQQRTQVADLLTSEEYNIFGVAKYIRLVADQAVGKTAAVLPQTVSAFPRINFGAFGGDSATWPSDNIKALGSEYTSRAWDDKLSVGWGEFVFEAYRDIRSSRSF
ncbi:hypothetical protein [Roseococcus pinisoli]|uniref:Uncharacterized protein n=1 Tax=Roseococcus pinisoli TaxID=2835040 RepID=A0ABS5QHB5_9PROT|nr:hypothetical protein [Roseococcus pinisoli]MBS7813091.1 hypothetical protein [Roseococcus pinisoli]